MNLTSHFFIFYFFPPVILLYYIFRKYKFIQNIIIIFASLVFYASFGIENLPILILPLFLDYILALYLYRAKRKMLKKTILSFGVAINLSLLGYFKYSGFIDQNFSIIFNNQHLITNVDKIILPVGISFITFQRISYIVDSYRKKIKPTTNLIDYCVYASLFPHLISGPIVRYSQIRKDLLKRIINNKTIFEASKYFALGLAMKILIANELYATEEIITKNISQINFLESLIFMIYFTLRIYIDFLGYSFMAIGLAKFLGFNFPKNFNSPYLATSITDFWRKWNITLSSWLRDYLYIPLGGNRKGKIRTYVNLLFTMLLAGLWHGANWSFVLWGGIHGVLLVIERFFSQKNIKLNLSPRVKNFITIILISLAWIPFKFTNINDAINVYKSLFSINNFNISKELIISLENSTYALFFAFIISFILGDGFIDKIGPSKKTAIIISILLLVSISFSLIRKDVPFIYFQF